MSYSCHLAVGFYKRMISQISLPPRLIRALGNKKNNGGCQVLSIVGDVSGLLEKVSGQMAGMGIEELTEGLDEFVISNGDKQRVVEKIEKPWDQFLLMKETCEMFWVIFLCRKLSKRNLKANLPSASRQGHRQEWKDHHHHHHHQNFYPTNPYDLWFLTIKNHLFIINGPQDACF